MAQAPPTWKRCVKEVGFGAYSTTNFVFAVGSMYVRKYFKPEAKEAMVEMTKYIRAAFRDEILPNLDWMDSVTKARAEAKLKKMDQVHTLMHLTTSRVNFILLKITSS